MKNLLIKICKFIGNLVTSYIDFASLAANKIAPFEPVNDWIAGCLCVPLIWPFAIILYASIGFIGGKIKNGLQLIWPVNFWGQLGASIAVTLIAFTIFAWGLAKLEEAGKRKTTQNDLKEDKKMQ